MCQLLTRIISSFSFYLFLYLNYEGSGRGGGRGSTGRGGFASGPIRKLGSREKVYDVTNMDLSPAVPVQGNGMIKDMKSPTDTSTKLAHGTMGIAIAATVGLYLYKKKRPTNKNTKHSVPESIDID